MTTKSIRILCQIEWPTAAVSRFWDGAGPFVDGDGQIWRGCTLADDLDEIEQAINGEAYTLNLSLIEASSEQADSAWQSYTNDQIIGGVVRLMIQPCDAADQPIGGQDIMFTGRIDNIVFDDAVADDRPRSTITVEVTNRFQMRRLMNGAVLSDADQRARSAAVNPGEAPDRFCERIPLLLDKTINWPRFW